MKDKKQLEEEFDSYWEEGDSEENLPSEKMFTNILEKINTEDAEVKPVRRFSPVLLWAFAASVALIIIAGLGIWYKKNTPDAVIPASSVAYTSAQGRGEKKITLADGSVIMLSGNAKIEVPSDMTTGERTVLLREGKAFFQVAKNPERPFSVETGDIRTTVLGTSFTITTEKDNLKTQVSVTTGKVRVSSKSQQKEYTLLPGDELVFDGPRAVFEKLEIKEAKPAAPAFSNSVSVQFENADFREVIRQLEADTHYVFDTTGVTGTSGVLFTQVYKNRPLDEVLNNLSRVYQIRFQKENGKIIVRNYSPD